MDFTPFIVQGSYGLESIVQAECAKRDLNNIQISLHSRTLAIIPQSRPLDSSAAESPESSTLDSASFSLDSAHSSAESKLCDEHFYNTSGYSIIQTCELLISPRESVGSGVESFAISLSEHCDKAFLRCFDSFIALRELCDEFCAQALGKLALLGVILRDMPALQSRLQTLYTNIASDPETRKAALSEQGVCIYECATFAPPKPMRFVFTPKERYERTHTAKAMSFYADERLRQSSRIEEAFYGVRAGELVGVYEFGDLGVAGRNLLGEYIPALQKPREKIIPTSSPHISFKAHDDRIEYFSQIQGFIAVNNQYTAPFASQESKHEHPARQPSAQATPESKNTESSPESKGQEAASPESKNADIFCFFNTAQIKACKSTNTPPLLGGIEAHITLRIESSDSSIDALGDGVYIEAMSVEISGDLGSETTIKAKHLILNGASHKSSQILAQSAKILTHKGLLCAQECVVKHLDSGLIYADTAKIQEANASTIYAKNIHIERLRNANACHFSKELIVDEIPQKRGDDNALIFDITADSAYRDYLARARIYHHEKTTALERTRAHLALLGRRFSQALQFLQKMQGFTKPQQEIALKEPSFALLFTRSRATYKLYKALESRIANLTHSLHKLERTICDLQARLKHAIIRIRHVGGFENYALLAPCSLQALHLTGESKSGASNIIKNSDKSSDESLLLQVGKGAQIIIEISEQEVADSGAESKTKSSATESTESSIDFPAKDNAKPPRAHEKHRIHLKAVE